MAQNSVIRENLRKCDDLASQHWEMELKDREKGYELWLKQVAKTCEFIRLFKNK